MRTSKFNISNREIEFVEIVSMAGNANVDTFQFTFDSEWDGLTKTLVLINGTQPALANLIDNEAIIPSSVYHDGILTFGVYGRNQEDEVVLSSLMYSLPIENGAYNLSGNPSNLPDKTTWDEYTDIMLGLIAQGQMTLEDCQTILTQIQDIQDDINSKVDGFDDNYEQKLADFNANVVSKLTEFNSNALSKTNDFNTNATNKTTDFNNNYSNKVAEVNQIIADFKAYIITVDYNYNNLKNKPQTWDALTGGESNE